jgi:predicted DCC family thiol-disulfide oxidoreductase YuxK
MSLNDRSTLGWTGGQYTVYRFLLGSYLLVHFVRLIPWGREIFSNEGVLPNSSVSPLLHLFPNVLALWDSPAVITCLLVLGALLSVVFAFGWHDRVAALALWYLWACLFGRNPLIGNPSLPFIGWLLLAHSVLPSAPYGSWAARGRPDPRGNWQMPAFVFGLAWALMAVGYSYSGYTKLVSVSWLDGSALFRVLQNPLARPTFLRTLVLGMPVGLLRLGTWGALALELGFAPLALVRKVRPWIWAAMVGLHCSLVLLINFADLTTGMLLLHLFTFDPRWIRPKTAAVTETLFYDGHCGLCHRAVRFVLAEDPLGNAFRFSALQGELFAERVAASDRKLLPDSVVVQTAEGALLSRSAAVLHVLARLGGMWRIMAAVGSLVPGSLLNRVYDRIARVRHRLFRAPAEACPIVPVELRARFDA